MQIQRWGEQRMVVGGVMLPLVDNVVSGVVGQTVWGVDVDPDCANGW